MGASGPLTQSRAAGFALEGAIVLAGLFVLVRAYRRRSEAARQRARPWPGSLADVGWFLLATVASVFAGVKLLQLAINRRHVTSKPAVDLLNELVFEGCLIVAIAGFHFGYRRLGLGPAASDPLRPRQIAAAGGGLFLAVMPVIWAAALGWQGLLELFHYPTSNQLTVETFLGLNSLGARGLFILFAAVIAPATEEIIFRGIIFRALRAHLPRAAAVGVSAVVFAGAHFDFSSFVPLLLLGAVFAVAYEVTGSIAVTMLAHALFNTNTIVALLLGVTA